MSDADPVLVYGPARGTGLGQIIPSAPRNAGECCEILLSTTAARSRGGDLGEGFSGNVPPEAGDKDE